MSDAFPTLANAPIVEAVLDIDCDMPPGLDVVALEPAASALFADEYPKRRQQFFGELTIPLSGEAPLPHPAGRSGVQALLFLHDDEKQVVQVRLQGFAFNRLAPYGSLDEYLPEIERLWHQFLDIAKPLQVRTIRLRYINRVLLPLEEGRVELDDYLRTRPWTSIDPSFTLLSFLNQHRVVDQESGHVASTVLAGQPSEGDRSPVILDITAETSGSNEPIEPGDWTTIEDRVRSLRHLKNRVFFRTLTDKCLTLFR